MDLNEWAYEQLEIIIKKLEGTEFNNSVLNYTEYIINKKEN